MSIQKGVARAAGVLMVAMLLSRVLGFVREQAMTSRFGKSFATDAYFAAFTIPDLLYNLLVGGALSAAFIPVFSGYLAKEQEEEGWIVASTVINFTIIVMTVGIVLGMVFTPYLIPLVAYKFSGPTLDLTITLTRIMFPAVLFTGLNGLMMGILNSYKHFTAPAVGAVIYNVAIIALGLALSHRYGIAGFSIGVVAGVLGNFFVQLPVLKRVGLRYRPVLDLKHPGVRRMGLLMIPALIGLSANQVNLVINQNLASGLSEGSITALRLANRLMLLPLGIFAFSIGAAVFPTLTSLAATNKMVEFRETFSRGVRSVIFITLPAAVGLMTLGVPIVRLLFQQGRFSHEATQVTAEALFFYCIGLFAQAAVLVIVRAFYALQDTTTPVLVSVSTIVLNYLLNITFIGYLGASGLALAYSLTGIFNMLALLFLLRKKIGLIDGRRLALSLLQVVGAASLMGAAAYGTAAGLAQVLDLSSKLNQALQVGAAVGAGVLVYALVALFLHMEEAEVVKDMLRRKFGGRVRAEA